MTASDPVIPIERARRRKVDPAASGEGPYVQAREFLAQRYTTIFARPGFDMPVNTLAFWRSDFYRYGFGGWHKYVAGDLRAEVYPFLAGRGGKVNRAAVDNLVDALRALANLPEAIEAPCWMLPEAVESPSWLQAHDTKPSEIIACRNGLLNTRTGELMDSTPCFFTLNQLDFDYVADASPPPAWLHFLHEIFDGDQESIDTLAEVFGLLLTPDTAQQKVFALIGPPRSGKGTAMRILRCLVGPANVCAPMLAGLGAQFGMQELIGKLLAIVSDARLSGRADVDAIVENILRVSGQDVVTLARKFQSDYTGQLAVRFVIVSNEVPALHDASGALASRFLILRLRNSFLGREDPALFDRLRADLPGILRWALDGLARLRARGHFVQPASAQSIAGEMRALSSPLLEFVGDCCIVDPGAAIEVETMYGAWREWTRESGRESQWTVQMFGSRLAQAITALETRRGPRHPITGKRLRQFVGVRLRSGADNDRSEE